MPALLNILLCGQLLGTALKRKVERCAYSCVFLEERVLRMQNRKGELPDSVRSVCNTSTANINNNKCYSSPPPRNHTNRKIEKFSFLY